MIVRTLAGVAGGKGEAHGRKWHCMRLLHREDGVGVTLTDSILEAGFDVILRRENHLEACYCLEGEGTVEELESGRVHPIRPGTLYAANDHDRYRIRVDQRMRLLCASIPTRTGDEPHDDDASLWLGPADPCIARRSRFPPD